ncbi:MAG: pyruvate kinase [Verrucomicrobiota bacterium]
MAKGQQVKKTKIVATIGPSSESEETLRGMILAGLNVVRINFSHARHDETAMLVGRIRRLADELNRPVAVLGDLRGPRVRVGAMDNGGRIELSAGNSLVLTPVECEGSPERVSVSYEKLADDVSEGDAIILDDGNLELLVEEICDRDVVGRITRGGTLSSHRGLNMPGRHVSLPSVTEKDFADVDFAIEQSFDFLALSFVQKGSDVAGLNGYMEKKGHHIPVISKIEKAGAIDDLEEILRHSYGVMVARGDLALEMSIEEVPIAQKHIIAACRKRAKPVITATQMLESMTHSHKPTRAEANDVANAVIDGTDAVMLSGESAIGDFPVKTVETMVRIVRRAERALAKHEIPGLAELPHTSDISHAVSRANHTAAEDLGAVAMLAYTRDGGTVRWLVCHRPRVPVLALCKRQATCRQLALSWGVTPVFVEAVEGLDDLVEVAGQEAKRYGLAGTGDLVTISATTHFQGDRTHNIFRVERLG